MPSTQCLDVVVSALQPTWICASGSVSRLNYANYETLSGVIAPAGASSATLTFTAFSTELGYDKLTVWRCTTMACTLGSKLLDGYSGSTIPNPVTSNTGFMLLQWSSDSLITYSGWSATWSSTAAPVLCSAGTYSSSGSGSIKELCLQLVFVELNTEVQVPHACYVWREHSSAVKVNHPDFQ